LQFQKFGMEWQCHACTLRNGPMALACSACGCARTPLKSWNCHACTFANAVLNATVCAVCGTSRQRNAAKLAEQEEHSKRKQALELEQTAKGDKNNQHPKEHSKRREVLELEQTAEGDCSKQQVMTQGRQRRLWQRGELEQAAKRLKAGESTGGAGSSGLRPTENSMAQTLRMPSPVESSSRSPPDNGKIPRCEVGDVRGIRAALQDVGVVLLRNVASCEELAHAERLFFHWLEDLPLGIRLSEPRNMKSSSWQKLGYINTGVIANYSIGQSEFMWYLRLLPRVRQVFADAWSSAPKSGNSSEASPLISSFDGCGVQRNIFLPEAEQDWRTGGRWFHLDQNHRMHPGLHAYQGVLNFYPTDANSGSTVVVPGSHHHFRQICEAHPHARGGFVKLDEKRDPGRKLMAAAVQVIMDPGDLLLWDSRIVHCNQGLCPSHCHSTGDTAALAVRADAAFSRLVAYIAMLPASRLSPKLALERRTCVRQGRGTGHDASYVPRAGKRIHVHPSFREPPASHPLWQLVDPGYGSSPSNGDV